MTDPVKAAIRKLREAEYQRGGYEADGASIVAQDRKQTADEAASELEGLVRGTEGDWIEWKFERGDSDPRPADDKVVVRFRDGSSHEGFVGQFTGWGWDFNNPRPWDIVAYRVP